MGGPRLQETNHGTGRKSPGNRRDRLSRYAGAPGARPGRRLHSGARPRRSRPFRDRRRHVRRPHRGGRRTPTRLSRFRAFPRCSLSPWPWRPWAPTSGVASGHEASGSAFNSIVQLEFERGVPRNPLINAGALVVIDAVWRRRPGRPDRPHRWVPARSRRRSRRPHRSGSRGVRGRHRLSQRQPGQFLRASNNLTSELADVLRVYFNQCALAMSCRQLARAGLYLANRGADPLTHAKVTTPVRARRINAIMMTCGHYDASGDFAFRVGLPGKSGVGGGILDDRAGACGHRDLGPWPGTGRHLSRRPLACSAWPRSRDGR